MRTTLNLDDDVMARLSELARERATSVSRVANELVRAGLRDLGRAGASTVPYEAPVLDTGRPLLDVTDVGEALERLEGG